MSFEPIFTEYFPRVYKYLYSRVGNNKSVAEDLAQETMLACYKHIDSYDSNKASMATWVFVIARNRLKTYYRDRRQTSSLDEYNSFDIADDEQAQEDAVILEETQRIVHKAIESLSKREQDVLRYRFKLEWTAGETAEALGLTAGNVRIIQMRALRKLKDIMEEQNYFK